MSFFLEPLPPRRRPILVHFFPEVNSLPGRVKKSTLFSGTYCCSYQLKYLLLLHPVPEKRVEFHNASSTAPRENCQNWTTAKRKNTESGRISGGPTRLASDAHAQKQTCLGKRTPVPEPPSSPCITGTPPLLVAPPAALVVQVRETAPYPQTNSQSTFFKHFIVEVGRELFPRAPPPPPPPNPGALFSGGQ